MHIRTTFTFAATLGLGALSTAFAGPTGGVVVNGQGTISTPSSTTTVIDQASQNLQVNWNTFNVAANENVQFHQPSASSVAFNRILDQNPSQIFGRIDANGQVVLVNPNGLLIGRTAQLNTSSLVVSSLDAIDFDATSGRYRFSTNRLDPGAVVNEGSITAGSGGSVTLLGGRVSNAGSIVADYGTVNLAAGRAATLDLAGDGLLRLEVGGDLLSNGSGAVVALENSGNIRANGGQVLLTANAVRDVFSNLINNSGVVRANRIENSGGTITLLGPEGTVISSGTLDASAGDTVSTGGSVAMLGERVGLTGNARVDVSGVTGGGTALVGGDYQGKNPDVLNAQRSYVGVGAAIDADAGASGDGGKVIVWSDDFTRFDGSISARGGSLFGNGGFAEVSGKHTLSFTGGVNMTAAHGAWGTLLLDPDDIIIDNTAGSPPAELSDDGIYDFGEGATASINLGVAGIAEQLLTTDVILRANNNITQSQALNVGVLQPGANGSLTLETTSAAGKITLGDITMSGSGGISVDAGGLLELNGALKTTNRAVSLDARSIDLKAGASIDTGAGASPVGMISMETLGGDIQLSGLLRTNGAAISVRSDTGSLTTDAGSSVQSGTGSVNLSAASAVWLGGTVTAQGAADITVTSDNSTIAMQAGGSAIIADNGTITLDARGNVTPTSIHADPGGAAKVWSRNGSIVSDSSTGTYVEAGTVTLIADNGTTGSIGATGTGNAVDTNAGTLIATASNGAFVNELNDVTLDNVDSGSGNVSITAGGGIGVGANKLVQSDAGIALKAGSSGSLIMATGSGITANTGGTIDLSAHDATVTNVRSVTGTVNITTAGGNIEDVAGGQRIVANRLNLNAQGGAIGALADFDINVNQLDVRAMQGIHVKEQDGLQILRLDDGPNGAFLSAGGSVTFGPNAQLKTTLAGPSNGGDLSITSTSGFITLGSDTLLDAGSGDITLRAQQDVTVGDIRTTGTATITSDQRNIVAGMPGTPIQAGTLILNATQGSVGNLGARIETSASTLSADSSLGVFIKETADVTLDDIDGGTGGVDVLAGNDITVSTIDTSGAADVTLTSTSGNILDASTTSTAIKADVLTLKALLGTIGNAASGKEIDANATSLAVDAGHGAYVGNAGALTVAHIDAGDGDVKLTTGGTATLGNVTTTAGDVAITATSGNIVRSGNTTLTADTLTLTASAGAVGAASGGEIQTSATSLNATAQNGVYVKETDGITLEDIDAGSAFALTAGGNVTVDKVHTTGSATITTTGSILDDLDPLTRIQANSLDLEATSGSIGGSQANEDIDTDVTTLTAHAGTGAFVHELNGLALSSVTTAAGDISVVSDTWNISAAAVSAPGQVALEATAGAILDDDNDGTLIAGGSVTLTANTSIGTGTLANFDTAAASSVDVQTSGALKVTVGSNSGQINLDISGAPILAQNAITLGTGTGRAGTVILQSAGNLNVAGLQSGAISIGANNTTGVGLVSGGTLTVPTVSTFTDAPANSLLVRGASDVVSDDPTNPRTLAFTANSLDFRSGAAGGATVLDTHLNRLDATIGNGQDLTIGEADGITLGTVSAAGGNVIVNAGGAVTDDGVDTTRITANTVKLTGTALGSALTAVGGALDTDTTTLDARASAGGVYVREVDALGLAAHATGGAVDVRTVGGALTVPSGAGAGVTGSGGVTLVSGAGNLALAGVIDGGSGLVTLSAGGANAAVNLATTVSTTGDAVITAGPGGAIVADAASHVTARNLTVTGSAIANTAQRLNTNVDSLTATATNGGIFVAEDDSLSLAATATGGTLDARTTNGSLSVTSAAADGITLVAGGDNNALTVGGPVNGRGGDVTLVATGVVGQVNVNGVISTSSNVVLEAGSAAGRGTIASNGGQVVANTLIATGASIGASGAQLATAVGSLNAVATNGGIYVQEADALNLTAAATGAVQVATTNGAINASTVSGEGVSLTAGGSAGDLTVTGGVSGGSGLVTLTAANAIALNGGVGSAGDVTLTAGSGVTLNGTVASTGSVALTSSDAIVAGAGSQLAANSATLRGSTIGSASARLSTAVGSLDAEASNGGIFVSEADALTLTASATNGPVDVRTPGGALTVASAVSNADVTLMSGDAIIAAASSNVAGINVNLTGTSIGSSSARLNTAATSLNTTSTNGGTFVNEADDLTLTASASGGALDVRAGGALNVAAVSGDSITLAAGGALTTSAGVQISTGSLTVTGSSIGSAGSRLNTNVGSLNATSTNGDIFVSEADALTLTANAAGGVLDVQTSNGALTVNSAKGTKVTLAAGGAGSSIALNGAVQATTADVTLTSGTSANRGAITGGAGNLVSGTTLTANGSSIGAASSAVNTSVDTLNANASSGDVYVREQNGITLANVQAAGKVDIGATGGNITVISVTTPGDVNLTASAGAIADDGDNNTLLSGSTITLLARSIGAGSAITGGTLDSRSRLDIDAQNLDATSTSGGIFIDSRNGLASASLHASGGSDGDVELLTASGDLNLASVSASDTLLLAAARNIYGLPTLGTITARAAELRAGGANAAEGHIGTLSSPLKLQLAAGNTLRMFVPQTVDPDDANRAPSTLPSAGVTSTLSLFGAPSTLSLQAGFGQFQSISDTQFTSPAEALVRSIQNQTATVQSVLGLDWASFDPNVSLFGTLDPSVCLPGDQRDEEQSAAGC